MVLYVEVTKVEGYKVMVNVDRVIVMRRDAKKNCTVIELEGRFEKVIEMPEQIAALAEQQLVARNARLAEVMAGRAA